LRERIIAPDVQHASHFQTGEKGLNLAYFRRRAAEEHFYLEVPLEQVDRREDTGHVTLA
jgi:hypothetical protein